MGLHVGRAAATGIQTKEVPSEHAVFIYARAESLFV